MNLEVKFLKYKIMVVFLILLIACGNSVFSVGNTSNNTNKSILSKYSTINMNLTNNTNNRTIYVNYNYGNDENDGLTPTKPKKTLRNAAQNAIENGTIYLEKGTYNEGKTFSRSILPWESKEKDETNPIEINKNQTIVSENAILEGIALSFSNQTSIRIRNITFQNCQDTILSFDANVIVENCVFKNNKLENGSLINKKSGNLILSNCQFVENTGNTGVAVYNGPGNSIIMNSTFQRNNATEDGGAVYSIGNLIIKSSIFNCSSASKSGGAICIKHGSANITDSIFSNSQGHDGGAIKNLDIDNEESIGICTIIRCNFTNNEGTVGGAINNWGTCLIEECNSNNNTSFSGGFINNRGNCTVTYNTITNNEACGGGAVSNVGKIVLKFNTITGNSADCGFTILNEYGCTVIATDNWWGSNSDPKDQFVGEVTYSPILASPPNIPTATKTKNQEISKKLKITDIK